MPISAALSLLLCACTHYVPIVKPMTQCEPKALLRACAAPTMLPEGTTYEALLGAYQLDRQALRECTGRLDGLTDFIGKCNAAIDEHNRHLGEEIAKTKASQ
jgi:hypothetical protein